MEAVNLGDLLDEVGMAAAAQLERDRKIKFTISSPEGSQ